MNLCYLVCLNFIFIGFYPAAFSGMRPLLGYHKFFRSLKTYCSATSYSSEISSYSIHPDTGNITFANILKRTFRKVRQHVNPLASAYQVPVELSKDWLKDNFQESTLPILIDIGCAKGTWAMEYAKANPTMNILGLEIRKPVVIEAMRRKTLLDLKNVHFMYANANVDVKNILSDIVNVTTLDMITIQFPDPHFKKRNHKRRVVNDELIQLFSRYLNPGKFIFIQSDVLEIMEHMASCISANPDFGPADGYNISSFLTNPSVTPIQTEREIATLAKPAPVYRMLFVKK